MVSAVSMTSFLDEMEKISGSLLLTLIRRALPDEAKVDEKQLRRLEYHFSPKAGDDKWDKLLRNARSQDFVDLLSTHPESDKGLVLHAQSMHDLSRGKTVGKIYSSRLPGRSYEIRDMGGDKLGCTCPDWRYKGSVNPGYECKHIRAHKKGETKVG